MSDGKALLRAILDNPDDDAPRLIYADWLEEYSDPDRATFIRAQIELARLPPDHADRDRLVQIERSLWKSKRAAWTAWVPDWARADRFRRGFLEEVRCDAADFIDSADQIRQQTPLQGVRLDRIDLLSVAIFRSRVLEGLRVVRLRGSVPAGDWWLFAECPYMGWLTHLEVGASSAADGLVEALVGLDAFPALRGLSLNHYPLGDDVTIRLVNHAWSRRLKELNLGKNYITAGGARAIAESPYLEGLEHLNLRGNPLAADRLAVAALVRRFGSRVRV
jgi:uncharacterized protein (TIGR02996 family)